MQFFHLIADICRSKGARFQGLANGNDMHTYIWLSQIFFNFQIYVEYRSYKEKKKIDHISITLKK